MNEELDERVQEVLAKPYTRALVPDENGGFSAEVAEFPGCFSEGETPAEAYENLEKAAANWVTAAIEQGLEIPPPRATASHSGKVALRMPKSLHAQAARAAERDGVSLNQWIVSAISKQVATEQTLTDVKHEVATYLARISGTRSSFDLRARLIPTGGYQTFSKVWISHEFSKRFLESAAFATEPCGEPAPVEMKEWEDFFNHCSATSTNDPPAGLANVGIGDLTNLITVEQGE